MIVNKNVRKLLKAFIQFLLYSFCILILLSSVVYADVSAPTIIIKDVNTPPIEIPNNEILYVPYALEMYGGFIVPSNPSLLKNAQSGIAFGGHLTYTRTSYNYRFGTGIRKFGDRNGVQATYVPVYIGAMRMIELSSRTYMYGGGETGLYIGADSYSGVEGGITGLIGVQVTPLVLSTRVYVESQYSAITSGEQYWSFFYGIRISM